MKAELYSLTRPEPIHEGEKRIQHMPESSIVYQARVSSPKQTDLAPERLIQYLIQHSHWSPFDMVDMTLKIETSRAIMAQILRHWSFRFQEFSQRYSQITIDAKVDPFEDYEMRMKADGGNRQGSSVENAEMTLDSVIAMNQSVDCYDDFIKAGVAPECARMVLPLATKTTAYMKGSVRSWMTYFWQRLDLHAQKEHRTLAWAAFSIFEKHFPIISSVVLDYKPQVVHLPAWAGERPTQTE